MCRKRFLNRWHKTPGHFTLRLRATVLPVPFKKSRRKSRNIDNPVGQLKDIQNRINVKLLRIIDLPNHVFGGRKGRSVIQNANHHLGRKTLVTIDVKQFFPSISNIDVHFVWFKILGCSPKIASILTKLTTFERRLPQGAPTSTALANLFLLSCDSAIREFCAANGIIYTSWVDDLAFSGKNARDVIYIAAKALRSGGLQISRRKVKVMPSSGRQVLMGVVVNNRPSVTKEYRRATRSGINKLRTGKIYSSYIESYLKTIRGRIAYINQTNPQYASNLNCQLDELMTQRL